MPAEIKTTNALNGSREALETLAGSDAVILVLGVAESTITRCTGISKPSGFPCCARIAYHPRQHRFQSKS